MRCGILIGVVINNCGGNTSNTGGTEVITTSGLPNPTLHHDLMINRHHSACRAARAHTLELK